ncbi:MAG: peptidoglycan-binding protein [Erysipelotrichia bacterium]|nr:peptidoglycan-binding protein [Erysipelotrichia bacterium]
MATNYVIQSGNIGIGVNKIQGYLNILQSNGIITSRVSQDGIFGSGTKSAVQQFQRYAGLSVDGIVGELTWDAMVNQIHNLGVVPNIPVASRSYFLSLGTRGLDVYKMQQYINAIANTTPCIKPINADGIFGNNTRQAVMMYQYYYGINPDGVLGSLTWDNIFKDYLQIM